jgi:predicted nucleic acid-binding protein
MPTVYIETSIISYAAARPSNDPHVLVRQEDAKRWWDEYSRQYDLFISQAVLDEAGHGDPAAAKQRLQLLQGLPLIPITAEVIQVARELIDRSLLPEKASADALHVAGAAIGDVEYLVTLNCRHIANAHILPKIYQALEDLGVPRPLICTPQEFFGDDQ